MPLHFLRTLAALSLATAGCGVPDDEPEHGLNEWVGSIQYSARWSAFESGGQGTPPFPTYSHGGSTVVAGKVTASRTAASSWAGYTTSKFAHQAWVDKGNDNCSVTMRSVTSGSGQGTVPGTLVVMVDDDGRYWIQAGPDGDPPEASVTTENRDHFCGSTSGGTQTDTVSVAVPLDGSGLAEPDATHLRGASLEQGDDGERIEVRWFLARTLEDVELAVDVERYDTWRPSGGTSSDELGDYVEVSALLRHPDGTAPQSVRLRKVTFELSGVSRVPGVMINAPLPDLASDRPDLDFPPHQPEDVVVNAARDVAVATVDALSAKANVGSYDWGAFGALLVKAELSDGRILYGSMEATGEVEILLPKRMPGSRIAQVWREQMKVEMKDDAADDEASEHGHPGDGLTLYEEYRGLLVDGKRAVPDPFLRDVFVENQDPRVNDVEAGGALLGQAGVMVHIGLTSGNHHNRIINFNSSPEVPRVVQQHALLIKKGTSLTASYAYVVGGGTPADCLRIELSPAMSVGGRTVAHEIAHCLNVRHHGPGDLRPPVQWEREERTQGPVIVEVTPAGREVITVFEEPAIPLLAEDFVVGYSQEIYLDVRHGPHSGVEDCFMRYSAAEAYFGLTAGVRYLADAALPMKGMCSSARGTGMNDAARAPQSRYGDAEQGHGHCLSHVCVSDLFSRHSSHPKTH